MANSDQTPYLLPQSNSSINDLALHFQQVNEARRLQAIKDKKEDDAHKFAMSKYLGKEFDPNDFYSQTGLDTQVNQYSKQAMNEMAQQIKAGVNDEDLQMNANQWAAKLNKLHQVGIGLRQGIGALNKGIGDTDKGYNVGAANEIALDHAVYDIDPKTGARTLKNINDIDPDVEKHVNFAQTQRKVNILNGDPFTAGMMKLPTRTEEGHEKTEINGKAIDSKYSYQSQPWMELKEDSKGNKTPVIKTEYKNIPQPDGTIKQTPLLANDAYEALTDTFSKHQMMRNKAQDDAASKGITLSDPEQQDLYARGMLVHTLSKDAHKSDVGSTYSDEDAIKNANAAARLKLQQDNHALAVEKFQLTGKTKNPDIASDINRQFDNLHDYQGDDVDVMGGKVYLKDGSLSNKPLKVPINLMRSDFSNMVQTYTKNNNVTGLKINPDGTKGQGQYVIFSVKNGVPQDVLTDNGTKFSRIADDATTVPLGYQKKVKGLQTKAPVVTITSVKKGGSGVKWQ